jgi:hypothetical protein
VGPKIRSFSVPRGDAQQNAQHEIAYTQRKCLKDEFLRRKAVSCCGAYEVQSHLDRDDSWINPPQAQPRGRTRHLLLSLVIDLPIRSAKAGVRTLAFDSDVSVGGYLSKTACGSVGFLCQLGHIREKRFRLADEKTHGS